MSLGRAETEKDTKRPRIRVPSAHHPLNPTRQLDSGVAVVQYGEIMGAGGKNKGGGGGVSQAPTYDLDT